MGTAAGGSAYRNGTCLTSPECEGKGGQSSGSCAGGLVVRFIGGQKPWFRSEI